MRLSDGARGSWNGSAKLWMKAEGGAGGGAAMVEDRSIDGEHPFPLLPVGTEDLQAAAPLDVGGFFEKWRSPLLPPPAFLLHSPLYAGWSMLPKRRRDLPAQS